jgi:hypothetical protein
VEAEGKHKLFGWLLVRSKISTADKLMARNLPSDLMCSLCDQVSESGVHLCLHCVYAQQVWVHVSAWTNGLVKVPSRHIDLEVWWWNESLRGIPKEDKRRVSAVLLYTACNVWKERNRRVFD